MMLVRFMTLPVKGYVPSKLQGSAKSRDPSAEAVYSLAVVRVRPPGIVQLPSIPAQDQVYRVDICLPREKTEGQSIPTKLQSLSRNCPEVSGWQARLDVQVARGGRLTGFSSECPQRSWGAVLHGSKAGQGGPTKP